MSRNCARPPLGLSGSSVDIRMPIMISIGMAVTQDMNPRDVVIVDAVRTPWGAGRRAARSPPCTRSTCCRRRSRRSSPARPSVDPGTVDDVIVGCVSQVGEQSATPGRMAWLAAGLPAHVPSTTIERKCGSSQQAVHFAAQGILSGEADIVIAGGRGVDEPRADGIGADGRRPVRRRRDRGVRTRAGLRRASPPSWSPQSAGSPASSSTSTPPAPTQRAAAAQDAGAFDREIVPVTTPEGTVKADETIRRGTTPEKLGGLKAVFETPELLRALPAGGLVDHRRQLLADHRRRQRAADDVAGQGRRAGAAPPRPRALDVRGRRATRC